MVTNLLNKIFGSRNERLVKQMRGAVARINALEPMFEQLTDAQLLAKTEEFRGRVASGQSLDSLLPEAFAAVREASKRVLGMRHFDVQLIGGMVLHEGKIAEMRTGEGKTLMATLPAYLNALAGKGVHVVTVNDYLARRDARWMGRLYEFLGLTTGVVVPGQESEEKRAAYACDITYATNNEIGFDYLRDNMAFGIADRVQRPLHYAIIDEVDSILIDEARTPLIISGPTEDGSELYTKIDVLIPKMTRQETEEGPGDYWVDEKARQVYLNDQGHERAEQFLAEVGLLEEGDSLYNASNILLVHHLTAALRAHALYQRDVHYIVRNREVVIVDEFTGRIMPGRRWSDGLHQAIEAKERVPIQNENQTLASITFQNLFRLYTKLAGMTGTADTEAYEFQQIYNLEVVVIPTNRPMIRNDMPDLIYLTPQDKYAAVIEDIRACRERGQPVLVGTTSIETSELLSKVLTKESIPHQVLNAKFHEKEAEIIAQAGRPGAVTIATNMAGRGTDIVLGGSLEADLAALGEQASAEERAQIQQDWQQRHEVVKAAGGLHIIGTERHESRRIDNQLRGRAGRQGDPGSSRFYLSLQDNLMRIFASERVASMMQKLGMQEGESIEHRWVTRAIENAQRKVEGHNFDIRKQLLEYDDVANDQRKVIYEQRSEVMASEDISATILAVLRDVLASLIKRYIPPGSLEEQWDAAGLQENLLSDFNLSLDITGWLAADEHLNEEDLHQRIVEAALSTYREKEEQAGGAVLRHFEKEVMLRVMDARWKDHLAAMDHLRQGIHLRGYAQKNPKQEYKREAFEMFGQLLERIKHEVATILLRVQVRGEQDVEAIKEQRRNSDQGMHYEHASYQAGASAEEPPGDVVAASETFVRSGRKVGRNEPCPCGSGQKYKNCHGKLA